MIKIVMLDPHTLPKKVLIDTAAYLMNLAGAKLEKRPEMKETETREKLATAQDEKEVDAILGLHNGEIEVDVSAEIFGVPPVPSVPAQLTTVTPEQDVTLTETPLFNPFAKPAAPVSPNVPQVDVSGLPWDARIHARTKTKNANGTWKLMRQVDLKLVDKVTAELRQLMALPIPIPAPFSPVAVPPPPAPLVDTAAFNGFVMRTTAAIRAQKLTQSQVIEAVQGVGIPTVPLLQQRPDLIPAVLTALEPYL